MEKVTGVLSFSVSVDCSECGSDIDLNDFEDDEGELSRALFGKVGEPAKWENIGATYECPKCNAKFELDKIEY